MSEIDNLLFEFDDGDSFFDDKRWRLYFPFTNGQPIHHQGREISFGLSDGKEMVENFGKFPSFALPVTALHDPGKFGQLGVMTAMRLGRTGVEFQATLTRPDKAKELGFRYQSPEVFVGNSQWQAPDGTWHANCAFGTSLVSTPRLGEKMLWSDGAQQLIVVTEIMQINDFAQFEKALETHIQQTATMRGMSIADATQYVLERNPELYRKHQDLQRLARK
jgi:hypothetical protein